MSLTPDVTNATPAVVESRDQQTHHFAEDDGNVAVDKDEDDVMLRGVASGPCVKISQKQKPPHEPLPAFTTSEARRYHGILSPDASHRETRATLPSASENDHSGGTPHALVGQRSCTIGPLLEVSNGKHNGVATGCSMSTSHGIRSWTTLAISCIEAFDLPKSTSAIRGGTLVSGMFTVQTAGTLVEKNPCFQHLIVEQSDFLQGY